ALRPAQAMRMQAALLPSERLRNEDVQLRAAARSISIAHSHSRCERRLASALTRSREPARVWHRRSLRDPKESGPGYDERAQTSAPARSPSLSPPRLPCPARVPARRSLADSTLDTASHRPRSHSNNDAPPNSNLRVAARFVPHRKRPQPVSNPRAWDSRARPRGLAGKPEQ